MVKGDFVRYSGTEDQLIETHITKLEAARIMMKPVGIVMRISLNPDFVEVSFFHADNDWLIGREHLSLINKKQLSLVC